MQVTRREFESVLVLSFPEAVELEGEASRRFREKIRRVVDEGRKNVVMDLGGVTFIDSSGLGALVSTLKALREAGGNLRLANVPARVRSVLEVTRLERVFESFDTVEEALDAARGVNPLREEG